MVVVLDGTTVRLLEDGHLRPPGGTINLADVLGWGLAGPLLSGLRDPGGWSRGQLGVHPPGRGGGLTGSRHAELRPPVCGDGVGGAVQGSTPTAEADLGPFEAKASDAGAGGAVDLLGGDLNGHFCAAGGCCVRVSTPR